MRSEASMDFRPRYSEGQVSESRSIEAQIVGVINNVPSNDVSAALMVHGSCKREEYSGAIDLALEGFEVINFSEIDEEKTDYRDDEPTLLYIQPKVFNEQDSSTHDRGCYIIHDASIHPETPTFMLLSSRKGDTAAKTMFVKAMIREFKSMIEANYVEGEEHPDDLVE